jgi:hypothetical protein
MNKRLHNGTNFKRNVVYQLTCPDCSSKYIGPRGNKFEIRFKEHVPPFRNNNITKENNLKFPQHLLHNGHAIRTVESIMENLHITNKGN